MTQLTDLSPEDAAILNRTPSAVALGAAYAEQDGAVSLLKEMKAGLAAAAQAAMAFPENDIIRVLAIEMQEVDEDAEPSGAIQAGDAEPSGTPDETAFVEERSPVRAPDAAIDLARQSISIMETNATLEETVQYKHWLYEIAKQVTLATKSGGFLGIGGTQVSEGEQVFLQELQMAMEIDV